MRGFISLTRFPVVPLLHGTRHQISRLWRRNLLIERSGSYELNLVEVRDKLKGLVGAPSKWGSKDAGGAESPRAMILPDAQSLLPQRQMAESYREAIIPLGSRPEMREKYVNFYNTVRYGRLMEDLDTMAVWISYTHHLGRNPTEKCGFSIVTALVDSIKMTTEAVVADSDILMRGHTTWVGNTSVEVTMDIDQIVNGGWQQLVTAKFVMVSKMPTGSTGKAFLCPMELNTEEEKAIFQIGEANKDKRHKDQRESLLKTPPSDDERQLIHDMFLQTLDSKAATFKRPVKPDSAVWLEDTLLKNLHICFPQERNLYNKIFGGFLMRRSFEIGWANACLYGKSRPLAVAVDDIMFRKPVEVGSLLFLSSQIVYTEGPYMQVKVHAEVVNSSTGEHTTTNIFHFTFKVKDGDVAEVIPKSYSEYMMYVDGKRHFDAGQQKLT